MGPILAQGRHELLRCRLTRSERRLRQFRDDLCDLFQRPGAGGAAAYKAQAAVGQRVFGNVIAVCGLDDLYHIVFAGGEIDLLDFATAFLGEIPCRLCTFWVILDFANTPFSEVQVHNEQHVISHGLVSLPVTIIASCGPFSLDISMTRASLSAAEAIPLGSPE